MFNCFATTNKGLEILLAEELTTLGAKDVNTVTAGLEFRATLNDIVKMNLHTRLASRIMIQLGHGPYSNNDDAEDIYGLACEINWSEWFHVGNTIKVSTNAIKSPLTSLEFVTLKVKDAICDYFNERVDARPNVDKQNPDMRIYNFLTEDTVTIYLDTSGDTLFKRGYRKLKLEAPIKENLAFGLIKLSGWTPEQPFFDPMCGSGTIAVEAICYGLNIAPGLNRRFAFEQFIDFDTEYFDDLKEQATAAIKKDQKLQVFASDISQKAIDIAKQNFAQIGLSEYVTFSSGNLVDISAPAENGIMVTNPPYGVRLEELEQLAFLYPDIASNLKKNFSGWNCYFLTADLRMPKLFRLKPTRKTPLFNGALECRLFEFKMVSGSNRNKE